LNKEQDAHFEPNIIPKGFKNEKELEQFLDKLNQKGENLSPEEKEKRMNCLKDIFDNIEKREILNKIWINYLNFYLT
jgi:hypothetical protein